MTYEARNERPLWATLRDPPRTNKWCFRYIDNLGSPFIVKLEKDSVKRKKNLNKTKIGTSLLYRRLSAQTEATNISEPPGSEYLDENRISLNLVM